jgi:NIPSNAP
MPKVHLLFALAAACCAAAVTTAAQSKPIAQGSRLFEMRTYVAAPGKFEELNARFRQHTNKLFVKHGMTIVGYWVPTEKGQGAENTLVYILAYPDGEAREKAWKAFAADPAWVEAKRASEVNGKLTEKVESVFLKATDYSPLK